MANFNIAYEIGRDNEGGYSNHPKDKGGETYAGVARNYWPNWEGWCIIDAYKQAHTLKQGQHIPDNPVLELAIKEFYRKNFWNRISGDLILDQQVANIFYDWSLTSGRARHEVQEAFNLTPDGKIGPLSIARINKVDPPVAFEMIKNARINYYKSLNQPAFIKGWLNRVDRFKYNPQ